MVLRMMLFVSGLLLIEAVLRAVKGLLFYKTKKEEDNTEARKNLKTASRFAYLGVGFLVLSLGYVLIINGGLK